MNHISSTSFGRRPIAAAQPAPITIPHASGAPSADKWALLRELGVARRIFGASDRDLTVLQALLSFLPGQDLRADMPLVVFPSNTRLRERLHDMPESTLRRHLAALVTAGLIRRQDSPNGKRFARRDAEGRLALAFGFDLSPLLARRMEIVDAATTVRADAAARHASREALVLQLRDVSCSVTDPEHLAFCEALRRALRRKLTMNELQGFAEDISAIQAMLKPANTQHSSGNDSQNERHIQDSNIYHLESIKEAESEEDVFLHLETVLEAFPDCQAYEDGKVTSWMQFVALAHRLYPMMGIQPALWHQALTVMGPRNAAISLAGVLQMFSKIRSPGAYFRSLTEKARNGQFRPTPMVMVSLGRLQGSPS